MKYAKGHKFYGPDGQGYELSRDLTSGEYIMESSFVPFGGAPKPAANQTIPDWLFEQLIAKTAADK